MNISSALGSIAGAFLKHRKLSAVIVAAGSGQRFGGVKKQFLNVGGMPVLKRTALAFEESELVDEIIVVTGEDDVDSCRRMLEDDITKLSCVVPGGKTRQESARLGLEQISPKSEFIAIHDGARCLITTENIDAVIKEAYRAGCAAAAEKAVNTVKFTDSNDIVEDTIDRDRVWLVETPQVFLADAYRAGVYTAEKEGYSVTDDCMLLEKLGFKVKMVSVGRQNIKLTYPEDMIFAEAVVKSREEKQED